MRRSVITKTLHIIFISIVISLLTALHAFAGEPSIVITKGNPSSSAGVPYTILFYVTDDSGIVSILVNGRELGPNGGTYYDAEWTTYHNGEITITATDNEGFSATVTEHLTNLNSGFGSGTAPVVETQTPPETQPVTQPVVIETQPAPRETQAVTQPQVVETAPAPQVTPAPLDETVVETIPETVETISEEETQTESDAFEYYELPDNQDTPVPPVARLNRIAAAAFSRGKLFSVKLPAVARLSRILQISITKGSAFKLIRPSSKNLTPIARMAFNKGRLFTATVPHAPSILKIASNVIKYTGTQIRIPESADITQIAALAYKSAGNIMIEVPKMGKVSNIFALAAKKADTLKVTVPFVVDLRKVISLAAAVTLSEKDIKTPALGEYTIISTMESTQRGGFSAPALMLISFLISLICMQLAIVMLHRKSRRLYKWFKEAYTKKGSL